MTKAAAISAFEVSLENISPVTELSVNHEDSSEKLLTNSCLQTAAVSLVLTMQAAHVFTVGSKQ